MKKTFVETSEFTEWVATTCPTRLLLNLSARCLDDPEAGTGHAGLRWPPEDTRQATRDTAKGNGVGRE